jgi:hypothetical protein
MTIKMKARPIAIALAAITFYFVSQFPGAPVLTLYHFAPGPLTNVRTEGHQESLDSRVA